LLVLRWRAARLRVETFSSSPFKAKVEKHSGFRAPRVSTSRAGKPLPTSPTPSPWNIGWTHTRKGRATSAWSHRNLVSRDDTLTSRDHNLVSLDHNLACREHSLTGREHSLAFCEHPWTFRQPRI